MQVPEVAEILLQTLFQYRDQKAYELHEFVLMPDHLHLLLTPNETASLETSVLVPPQTPRLKPRPPKEEDSAGPKGPTPNTISKAAR